MSLNLARTPNSVHTMLRVFLKRVSQDGYRGPISCVVMVVAQGINFCCFANVTEVAEIHSVSWGAFFYNVVSNRRCYALFNSCACQCYSQGSASASLCLGGDGSDSLGCATKSRNWSSVQIQLRAVDAKCPPL